MTNEEAIRWLMTAFLVPSWDSILKEEMIDAGRLATAALEKQIPRKPHKNRNEYYCPVCRDADGEKVCVGKNHTQGNKTRDDYCFRCGQAIDWSDEK